MKLFPNAKYKKFNTAVEAEEYIRTHNPTAVIDTSALQTSTSTTTALPRYVLAARAFHVTLMLSRHQSMQAGRSTKSRDREGSGAGSDTTGHREDRRIVYCDGACKGNGQQGSVAGVGVYWGHGDPRPVSFSRIVDHPSSLTITKKCRRTMSWRAD